MLNYLELKNNFWRIYEMYSFGQAEIALYFHLLEICDKCSWTNPFKRQNIKICAHLNMSKKTLESTRNKLKQAGLIDFDGLGKGSTNIRYEIKKVTFYSSKATSKATSYDPSNGSINKEEKKEKKIEVVAYAQAVSFFLETKNFRSLGEKHFGPDYHPRLEAHFGIFYNDKVDIGEFDNKTREDLVKHFSMWLPIYLRATAVTGQKVNGAAGNESKTDGALRRHQELLKEFENGN